MAILQSVPNVEPFFPEERPTHEKFSDISSIANIIIDNQITVNDSLTVLLQGAAGGAEQAIIPFALAAAPIGWTRDVTFGPDQLLRVTDGVTVPPGFAPQQVGGLSGGNWIITGISTVGSSTHEHNMNDHNHDMAHTHAGGSHSHPQASHTHSLAVHSHAINNDPGGTTIGLTLTPIRTGTAGIFTFMAQSHSHSLTVHNHGGMTSGGGTTQSASGTTFFADGPGSGVLNGIGTVSDNSVSSGNGTHNHTPSHNGEFRPKYLNMLACKKD